MKIQKKQILFLPFPLLSHYLRCLQLADAVREDFEILFSFSTQYNHLVEKAGFETFACENFDAEVVMNCARNFDFSWLNVADLERIFLSQVKAIERLRPDIVVGDVNSTLAMAAEKTNARYISLLNGYFTKYYQFHRQVSGSHKSAKYLKLFPNIFHPALTRIGERVIFQKIHKPFVALREKYHLSTKKNYQDELEGSLNLVCDLPELFPQQNLPSHYKIIGPLFYRDENLEEEIIGLINNGKKTILVSMGSSGDWTNVNFLSDKHFQQYNIVIGGTDKTPLKGDNIFCKQFLNSMAVFPHVDLTICHGGNGTIYQSLANGVPVLSATSHFEQEWNMQRIIKLRLGDKLDKTRTNQQAIEKVEHWMGRKQTLALKEIAGKISVDQTKSKFKVAVKQFTA